MCGVVGVMLGYMEHICNISYTDSHTHTHSPKEDIDKRCAQEACVNFYQLNNNTIAAASCCYPTPKKELVAIAVVVAVFMADESRVMFHFAVYFLSFVRFFFLVFGGASFDFSCMWKFPCVHAKHYNTGSRALTLVLSYNFAAFLYFTIIPRWIAKAHTCSHHHQPASRRVCVWRV